jgi:uncharacterized membrane protein
MLPAVITTIQIIFAVFLPSLILFLEKRSKIIQFISPIAICYLLGFILGHLSFLSLDKTAFTMIYKISIMLVIPILLLNSNISSWIKPARKAMLSYFLSVISVLITSTILFFIFQNKVIDAWKVSSMLVGVYSGGTVNLNAIGLAHSAQEEVVALLNSSDLLLGAIYYIFLITLIKPFLGLFLPDYKFSKDIKEKRTDLNIKKHSHKQVVINIVIVLLIGIGILGIAFWLSNLIKGDNSETFLVLFLTSLGISTSFIKKIHRIEESYNTAYYLLLIFSFALSVCTDVSELLDKSSILFLYTAYAMLGSILLHFILAAIFRIDRDTVIITSTAAIYGPAFIGPVANAIKNRDIIGLGITIGLLGYAIGTYLGMGMAFLLK